MNILSFRDKNWNTNLTSIHSTGGAEFTNTNRDHQTKKLYSTKIIAKKTIPCEVHCADLLGWWKCSDWKRQNTFAY